MILSVLRLRLFDLSGGHRSWSVFHFGLHTLTWRLGWDCFYMLCLKLSYVVYCLFYRSLDVCYCGILNSETDMFGIDVLKIISDAPQASLECQKISSLPLN